MKKLIVMLLALTMLFALCAPAVSAAGPAKLNYATGGTSGTYYGFSGVIANVLNEKLSDTLKLKVESTGASKANIQMLASGQLLRRRLLLSRVRADPCQEGHHLH